MLLPVLAVVKEGVIVEGFDEEAVVGEAVVGEAVVREAVVREAVVGEAVVGEAVAGAAVQLVLAYRVICKGRPRVQGTVKAGSSGIIAKVGVSKRLQNLTNVDVEWVQAKTMVSSIPVQYSSRHCEWSLRYRQLKGCPGDPYHRPCLLNTLPHSRDKGEA